jgi:periplasmic copper chaperone A
MITTTRFYLQSAIVSLLTIVLVACGTTAVTHPIIEHPWSRATAPGAVNGAVFVTIRNADGNEDRLVSAACDIADDVQLHTVLVGADGVKAMRQVEHIVVPANGSVVLKPGSFHVMLIGLKRPLVAGEKLPLTFTFANSGTQQIIVPVGEVGAMGPAGEGDCPLCHDQSATPVKTP